MTASRIEWREPTSPTASGEYGYVGGLHLFTYFWRGQSKTEPYGFQTTLPGYRRDLRASSPETAKVACEVLLVRFVRKIGAAFPADAATPPDTEETQP